MQENTRVWDLYESGIDFNNRLDGSVDGQYDYYDQLELNINYVEGRHWIGLESDEFPKATFNYEKRFVDLFTSILCSAATGISIEPFATIDTEEEKEVADMALAAVTAFMDLTNYDAFKRYATRDASIMGDIAAHYWFDPDANDTLGEQGAIKREAVYGNNVFLGNANTEIISKETQPYVLISGRDFVKDLKEEAEQNGNDPSEIKSDTAQEQGEFDNYEESSAKGFEKATYVLEYRFEGDTVLVSKMTQNAVIYEDIDTGLTVYPVAWLVWEKKWSNYHGKALVEDIHHNQNYINRAFAMLMYYTMSVAFGKPIYNADLIDGWTTELGVAVGIEGLQPGQSVQSAVGNITPSSLSGFVTQTIDLAIQYTKEVIGVTDSLLGDVRPDNKGAIVVATKNTQAPLENQKERIRQWTEEQVIILEDMMATYYGTRKVIVTDDEGSRLEEFNFDKLKDTMLNTKVEIGDASYFNEVNLQATLDNYFDRGIMDAVRYVEASPTDFPGKQNLIDEMKEKMGGGDDSEELKQKFDSLTPEQQQQIMQLPPEQQADAVRQL